MSSRSAVCVCLCAWSVACAPAPLASPVSACVGSPDSARAGSVAGTVSSVTQGMGAPGCLAGAYVGRHTVAEAATWVTLTDADGASWVAGFDVESLTTVPGLGEPCTLDWDRGDGNWGMGQVSLACDSGAVWVGAAQVEDALTPPAPIVLHFHHSGPKRHSRCGTDQELGLSVARDGILVEAPVPGRYAESGLTVWHGRAVVTLHSTSRCTDSTGGLLIVGVAWTDQ